MEEETKAQIKCPMCGGEEFDDGLADRVLFRKDSDGLFTRYPLIGEKTYAKRCTRCGFLAIFTE